VVNRLWSGVFGPLFCYWSIKTEENGKKTWWNNPVHRWRMTLVTPIHQNIIPTSQET